MAFELATLVLLSMAALFFTGVGLVLLLLVAVLEEYDFKRFEKGRRAMVAGGERR